KRTAERLFFCCPSKSVMCDFYSGQAFILFNHFKNITQASIQKVCWECVLCVRRRRRSVIRRGRGWCGSRRIGGCRDRDRQSGRVMGIEFDREGGEVVLYRIIGGRRRCCG